jgi:hypothetical protein
VLGRIDAEERVGKLGVLAQHVWLEPGHRCGVGQHVGDDVTPVPDHLHEPGVRERLEQHGSAVEQVGAGVAEPGE